MDSKEKKRSYGDGRVFQRSGSSWTISYCHNGKEIRETTKANSKSEAKKILKQRLGAIAEGKAVVSPAKQEKYTFTEMADLLLLSHQVAGFSGAIKWPVKHLRRYFGFDRAMAIGTERILAYVEARRKEGAKDGTLKLELAALSRMFSLAINAKPPKLAADAKPSFPKIALDNARQGFVSHPDFLMLQGKLPDHLKDPVSFLYYSGWRVREMRKIQWKHLDPSGKSLRLPPELSKNKKGRLLPLTRELAAIIRRAKARRRLDCLNIFHHNGKPFGSFRKAWKTACVAVGLGRFIINDKGEKKYEGIIVHDLRRSCVRHLVQAGVGEKLAMQLTGHKTRSVFDRYNIVSDADLQQASERQQTYLAKQNQEPTTVTSMSAGG